MRVLVLSDIHANLAALEAVLQDARGSHEAVVCLGDLVGYGPYPNETIRRIRDVCDVVLGGNHDLAASGKLPLAWFSSHALTALEWTIFELTQESSDYLSSLESRTLFQGIVLSHGSPAESDTGYVLSPDDAVEAFAAFKEPICLHGHSHVPLAFSLAQDEMEVTYGEGGASIALEGRKWLINPGSVGFPRDAADAHSTEGEAHAAARYGLLDMDTGIWTFHRVEYDLRETSRLMQSLGLW